MILTRKDALKELIIFSLPIIFGHVGLMLVGTGDMIIAGRYSKECLAAIGLAISIANPIMMLGIGLQMAISPWLAQQRGKGEDVGKYFWSVMIFSLLIGLVTCLLTLLSIELIPFFNYGEKLSLIMKDYLFITSFSTFGINLYQGLKEFLQSQEKAIAANVIAFMAAGLNLVLNYCFVFGDYNFPQLHEVGLAWASLSVRLFMGGALFIVAATFVKYVFSIEKNFFKEVMKLGMPISITVFFEVLAFCSVTLFVGKFGELQTAANNIALNLASLSFMLPLSISSAVSVKIGHAFGEKNIPKIKTFLEVSLFTSFLCTGIMASAFYFLPHFALGFYSTDVDVLHVGRLILFWVACFQLFDGAQVTLSGILRGVSVTLPSFLANFAGYWIIGIPLGYYLGFKDNMQAEGFWIGLAISLASVAISLALILKIKMKNLELEYAKVN
ncbi:MAG: MATE family efflux transporter [Bacteriovoracaceae bacterium]